MENQKRPVGRPRKYPIQDEKPPKKTKKGFRKYPDDVCSLAMMAHILKHYQKEGMSREEAQFEYYLHMKQTAQDKIQEFEENLKRWNAKLEIYNKNLNEISNVIDEKVYNKN